MECKTTSTRRSAIYRTLGFTVPEMIVAIGVVALLFLTLCAFSTFCGRSFAALFNYVDLDDANRIAIDKMTRDVRQANRVNSFTGGGTILGLEDADGSTISYVYSPTNRTLVRIHGNSSTYSDREVILTECDRLVFELGQRNTEQGGYDVFPVATDITLAKVIKVSWVCSRSLFGRKENTESVQTARIVIRKQGV